MEKRNRCATPIGYRAVVIAECARGRLRGRGTHPSATAKSTALNAADSGRGGVSARRGEIKARGGTVWAHLAICLHLPCLRLPCVLSPQPRARGRKGGGESV